MTEEPSFTCENVIGKNKKVCGRPLKRIISGGLGFILKGDGWTSSGKKDANYNRDRTMDAIREHPDADPYSGYRNWDEEN